MKIAKRLSTAKEFSGKAGWSEEQKGRALVIHASQESLLHGRLRRKPLCLGAPL